jgi:putative ABC transport system permease protein
MSINRAARGHLSFTLSVSALLAFTVGLNVVVFAFVNALWLRPLPVTDPDRVVAILGVSHSSRVQPYFANFERVAQQVATDRGLEPNLQFVDVPRTLEVMGVTAEYFRLFGLDIRGRDFTEADDRVGAEPVAIISDRLWSQGFGRRPDIVGAVVTARPLSVRIVGVAPRSFEGARRGERTDVWVPRTLMARVLRVAPQPPSLSTVPGAHLVIAEGQSESGTGSAAELPLMTWARLRPGDTVGDAERRVQAETRATASLVPVRELFGTPQRRTVLIREGNTAGVVAGLAMLVLLGGCAALASLILVHYERRRLEFGIRTALGASPMRLVRFLGRELVVIGVAGTVGALIIAHFVRLALPSLDLRLPAGIDLARLDLSFDWRVLLAGLTMTTVTLAVAVCLPILRVARGRLAGEVLSGPATTASMASQRVRQGLLALLVGATVVVLVAAALFIRSVEHAFGQAAGFDVERTMFLAVPVNPPVTFRSYEFQGARSRMAREALQAIPGVERVALGEPPISESAAYRLQQTRPLRTAGGIHELRTTILGGSPDLLSTLGIPIVLGRGLATSDLNAVPIPTVVTESMAGKLWPEGPLGQLLGGSYTVVGIARDFAFGSLANPAEGVLIVPRDDRSTTARFVVRSARSDATFADEIRRTLREVLPDTAAATVMTGREVLAQDLGRQRLGAWFFSGFGLVALVVGAGSVFGLVAYLADSRRREFGVRLALGATPRDLLWQASVTALLPVVAGLVSGLATAALVSRVFAAMLVGVSPVDGLTYGVVAAAVLGAASGAAILAAWRLRSVRPAEALRTS